MKDESAAIDGQVIISLISGPILVTSGADKYVVGIVTAFDLLWPGWRNSRTFPASLPARGIGAIFTE